MKDQRDRLGLHEIVEAAKAMRENGIEELVWHGARIRLAPSIAPVWQQTRHEVKPAPEPTEEERKREEDALLYASAGA